MKFKKTGLLALLAVLLLVSACSPSAPTDTELILATTTSTQDSGLLDVLIPAFEKYSGLVVKTVAVGTGQALKMGEEGNADVLLVHAPDAEQAFMEAGFGSDRQPVMHNDFVLLGPANDPAGIGGSASTLEVMKKLASSQAAFISRGDDSGTHKLELKIWSQAGITPDWEGYIETGQGMGATLLVASEKSAYTLSDRGTYLANQAHLALSVLYEGDASLLNPYHVIVVNAEKWPLVNKAGAEAFARFLTSAQGQDIIREFGKDRFGQPLFFPDVIP